MACIRKNSKYNSDNPDMHLINKSYAWRMSIICICNCFEISDLILEQHFCYETIYWVCLLSQCLQSVSFARTHKSSSKLWFCHAKCVCFAGHRINNINLCYHMICIYIYINLWHSYNTRFLSHFARNMQTVRGLLCWLVTRYGIKHFLPLRWLYFGYWQNRTVSLVPTQGLWRIWVHFYEHMSDKLHRGFGR